MVGTYELREPSFDLVDASGQRSDVVQQVAGDLRDRAGAVLELVDQVVQQLVPVQRPGRNVQVRIDLVQEPAHLGLHRGAAGNQRATVV